MIKARQTDDGEWRLVYELPERYPTVDNAIEAMEEILTEEWLESNGYRKRSLGEILEDWISDDGTIVLTKGSNMVGRGWFVHLDNQDFQTIGGLSVKYVWQLDLIKSLLKK